MSFISVESNSDEIPSNKLEGKCAWTVKVKRSSGESYQDNTFSESPHKPDLLSDDEAFPEPVRLVNQQEQGGKDSSMENQVFQGLRERVPLRKRRLFHSYGMGDDGADGEKEEIDKVRNLTFGVVGGLDREFARLAVQVDNTLDEEESRFTGILGVQITLHLTADQSRCQTEDGTTG